MVESKFIYYLFVFMVKVASVGSTHTSVRKGKIYTEERRGVVVSSILEEIKGVSKINCALRCRRLKECIRPATEETQTGTVCLLLKDPDDAGKYANFPKRVFDNFQPQGMLIFSF